MEGTNTEMTPPGGGFFVAEKCGGKDSEKAKE